MNVAASVRAMKDEHPEMFCGDKRCLWRVVHRDGRVTPCPKHVVTPAAKERAS